MCVCVLFAVCVVYIPCVCVCVCIFGELSARLWRSVCRSSLSLLLACKGTEAGNFAGAGAEVGVGLGSGGSSPARPLTIKVNEYFNIGKQITHMGNGNGQHSHDLCMDLQMQLDWSWT